MATFLASFATIHLPGGDDLLLEGRMRQAKGHYGLKPGTSEVLPGTCTVDLELYGDDDLITREEDGRISLETLEQSSVTVGMHGTTLFSGRVRQAELVEDIHKSTVKIALVDAISELAGQPNVDIGLQPDGLPMALPAHLTGERINRVLDSVSGWGSTGGYRSIDSGTVRCEGIPADLPEDQWEAYGRAGNPVALLNLITQTEGGRIAVRHGRPARDREYNRGLLTFSQRGPAGSEAIHIDSVNARLDGVSALRSVDDLVVQPNREEIFNVIRLHSPDRVNPAQVFDRDSIERYGLRLLERDVLAEGEDAEDLARFLLSSHRRPRDAVRQVKLSPWLWPQTITEKCYQLSVNDVIRLTYREPTSGALIESVQQINRVDFHIQPGDNPTGAICDMVLDLEAPEAIASWRYGIRGQSELDETTVFSRDIDDETDQTVPAEPYLFTLGQSINNRQFNSAIIQNAVIIAEAETELTRTRETTLEQLRRELSIPEGTSDPAQLALLFNTLDAQDFRERPAVDSAGRPVPVDGSLTVNAATLEVMMWSDAAGGDVLVARAGEVGESGPWTLDGSDSSRLNFGNWLGDG